jgi:hypothetical protein
MSDENHTPVENGHNHAAPETIAEKPGLSVEELFSDYFNKVFLQRLDKIEKPILDNRVFLKNANEEALKQEELLNGLLRDLNDPKHAVPQEKPTGKPVVGSTKLLPDAKNGKKDDKQPPLKDDKKDIKPPIPKQVKTTAEAPKEKDPPKKQEVTPVKQPPKPDVAKPKETIKDKKDVKPDIPEKKEAPKPPVVAQKPDSAKPKEVKPKESIRVIDNKLTSQRDVKDLKDITKPLPKDTKNVVKDDKKDPKVAEKPKVVVEPKKDPNPKAPQNPGSNLLKSNRDNKVDPKNPVKPADKSPNSKEIAKKLNEPETVKEENAEPSDKIDETPEQQTPLEQQTEIENNEVHEKVEDIAPHNEPEHKVHSEPHSNLHDQTNPVEQALTHNEPDAIPEEKHALEQEHKENEDEQKVDVVSEEKKEPEAEINEVKEDLHDIRLETNINEAPAEVIKVHEEEVVNEEIAQIEVPEHNVTHNTEANPTEEALPRAEENENIQHEAQEKVAEVHENAHVEEEPKITEHNEPEQTAEA